MSPAGGGLLAGFSLIKYRIELPKPAKQNVSTMRPIAANLFRANTWPYCLFVCQPVWRFSAGSSLLFVGWQKGAALNGDD